MSELWIIGDGNELENLKLFCSQNNLSEQIKFLGYCEDVMSLLCQSDIYVFASESEGLSNAVLEAMAVGLPSVVVDAPGVSECHIDCQSGFVVPRNIKIFCEKLEILASDQKLRRSMGDAARLRIKNEYSISASRKRYLNLYDEVMRSGSCVES